jgi:hypothetical protein
VVQLHITGDVPKLDHLHLKVEHAGKSPFQSDVSATILPQDVDLKFDSDASGDVTITVTALAQTNVVGSAPPATASVSPSHATTLTITLTGGGATPDMLNRSDMLETTSDMLPDMAMSHVCTFAGTDDYNGSCFFGP